MTRLKFATINEEWGVGTRTSVFNTAEGIPRAEEPFT